MSTTPRIPAGGLILVTGANGYIASHVVDQLIKKGYRVRGTVRDTTAQAWMTSHFGEKFSLVQVPDLSTPNAFDEAVKDVDGIAHVASNVQFSPDAESFIPPVVQAAVNVLEAAAKQPSVKSVVYCSSQAAAYNTIHLNTPYELTADSWNDEAVEEAWKKDTIPDMTKMTHVYSASKVLAEKASWDWVKKHQPHFAFNSVLPNLTIGGVISLKNQGFRSSSGLIKGLWDGHTMGTELILPQWVTDAEDTALVFIAALVFPDVKNERLFSMAHQFDWIQILDLLKKTYPEHKFLDSLPDVGKDMGKIPNERAEELVRRMGKPGFASLEEAIRKSVAPILEAEAGAEYPLTELDRLMLSSKQQSQQE